MSPDKRSGEFGLIDWIRQRAGSHPAVVLGIGDDCAVLEPGPGRRLLVTTDMLLEGRHFRLEQDGAEAVGYKALGVNLSDIAAMAGRPLAAFVSVALPVGHAQSIAAGLLKGMEPLAFQFGVALAGGDTNAWEGPLVVSVTVVGEATERGSISRAGAKAGDVVAVTGPLGGSLLGGRHLRPEPRIFEALALNDAARVHAMIDLSDGLSSDLSHIVRESGVGAILEAAWVPIHPDALAASLRDGREPLEHALHDGEDFELCLTLSRADFERLERVPLEGIRLEEVGVIVEEPGLWIRAEGGEVKPLAPGGFDHLKTSTPEAPTR